MIFYACDIPEDLTYDIERDVWIRFDGDIATLGMTDVAQTRCGKFAALSFREVGKKVAQGKALATIESAKWVGPFPAPFSCEIVETNEECVLVEIFCWRIKSHTQLAGSSK
jgi:glycine cleavage system H protein